MDPAWLEGHEVRGGVKSREHERTCGSAFSGATARSWSSSPSCDRSVVVQHAE